MEAERGWKPGFQCQGQAVRLLTASSPISCPCPTHPVSSSPGPTAFTKAVSPLLVQAFGIPPGDEAGLWLLTLGQRDLVWLLGLLLTSGSTLVLWFQCVLQILGIGKLKPHIVC